MRSRALFLVAASLAAILVGCGGGGGGNGGGGNNPPPTTGGVPGATQPGDSVAMVNLPGSTFAPTGRVNVAYLPLQGRAIESITAFIPSIELGLGSDTFIESFGPNIQFVLNGSTVQQRSTAVPITDGFSRPFDTFYLNINTLAYDQDTSTPSFDFTFGNGSNPFVQEQDFNLVARVFPSRETTIPVFLNDSMVEITTDPDVSATFLSDAFNARNGNPLVGFISDFLTFDISGMGVNRPTMGNGNPANRAHFSGDRFAFSEAGPGGYFELLTDDLAQPRKGEFQDPPAGANAPGVYRTLALDPTDPNSVNTITEIFGIYRQFIDTSLASRTMVRDTGNFEVILMPKTPDDDNQQILLVRLNGSVVTNMYWGDAHLASGSFVAYPLLNLATGSTANSIQGNLNGFLDVNASPVSINIPSDSRRVRYGRYQITTVVPSGFSSSGRFIVFRR